MQRHIRHYRLFSRLIISFILSISVSLLLILTTNDRRNSYLTSDKTSNIADRIVLFVRTSNNCESRLNYLLQSWISTNRFEQRNLYLITDYKTNITMLNSFRNILETKCPQTHNLVDLCCKTAHEFNLFYNLTSRKTNLEWMCRFDDDQYVNLNNLYKYLSTLNASKAYYIGRASLNKGLRVHDDKRTYYVDVKILPSTCLKRGISDDACIGYLIELILNISLTSMQDLFHSHLEKLDESFRDFSLDNLTRAITFGFAWDRYTLDWLPIIHQLLKLVNQNQIETANSLWLFLRNYEKEHPENLTNKYDQSCISYQKLRNQTIHLQITTNKTTILQSKKNG
jgi:fringe protein